LQEAEPPEQILFEINLLQIPFVCARN